MKTPRRIAERALALLASVCFVASFAVAALLPPLLPLSAVIFQINDTFLPNLQLFVRTRISEWVWRTLFLPLLGRPGWLLPLALGLVFAGLALSAASRSRVPRSPPRQN